MNGNDDCVTTSWFDLASFDLKHESKSVQQVKLIVSTSSTALCVGVKLLERFTKIRDHDIDNRHCIEQSDLSSIFRLASIQNIS